MEKKKTSVIQMLSAEEKKALALKLLTKEYARRIAALPTCKLYSHPFRLKSLDEGCPITYLNAGSSRGSLEQMCYHLQINLASFSRTEIDPENIKALRIITCEEKTPSRHRVYFEALTAFEYYLCGEASDFSGGGSYCKDRLKIVFDYLAELAGIQVEKINLNYERHIHARSAIGIAVRADCQITRMYHRVSPDD